MILRFLTGEFKSEFQRVSEHGVGIESRLWLDWVCKDEYTIWQRGEVNAVLAGCSV